MVRGRLERSPPCLPRLLRKINAGRSRTRPRTIVERIAAHAKVGHCGSIGTGEAEQGFMFALTADHLAVRDMAKAFADERMAPNALHWDETEHFPVDVLREAAALGMAAIYVGEKHGGSAMTRLDAALIFEALSTGCPSIASFL
jgi:hypothetical protein